LKQRNFTFSQAITDLLTKYEVESDSVKSFFIEMEYEVNSKAQIPYKKIYDEYKEYCTDGNFKPVNKKTFKNRLLGYGMGIAVTRINSGYVINLARIEKENIF